MTSNSLNRIHLDQDLTQILLPLCYFDIFSFPLNLEEIYQFGRHDQLTKGKMKSLIDALVERGFLFQIQNYYLLANKPDWVLQREENTKRAEKFLPKARMMTRIISKFPFVRAVFVSGSLSKKVMPPGGDIDYFIITQPGRLWVARTLLVLFKKIFLLNSHKYFCVNYFVDEDHLEIEEKNLFTATEIATLLPLYGQSFYQSFMENNQWIKAFFPNYTRKVVKNIPPHRSDLLQKSTEYFLKGKAGDSIDRFFMRKTIQYWEKKFQSFDQNKFEVALKSRQYVSKHHPLDFQSKVLQKYQERIAKFEHQHKISLHQQ